MGESSGFQDGLLVAMRSTEPNVAHCCAVAAAEVACVELPYHEWPLFVPTVTENVTFRFNSWHSSVWDLPANAFRKSKTRWRAICRELPVDIVDKMIMTIVKKRSFFSWRTRKDYGAWIVDKNTDLDTNTLLISIPKTFVSLIPVRTEGRRSTLILLIKVVTQMSHYPRYCGTQIRHGPGIFDTVPGYSTRSRDIRHGLFIDKKSIEKNCEKERSCNEVTEL
jgi:hypothetical protein